jgi:hypothetical protein
MKKQEELRDTKHVRRRESVVREVEEGRRHMEVFSCCTEKGEIFEGPSIARENWQLWLWGTVGTQIT